MIMRHTACSASQTVRRLRHKVPWWFIAQNGSTDVRPTIACDPGSTRRNLEETKSFASGHGSVVRVSSEALERRIL